MNNEIGEKNGRIDNQQIWLMREDSEYTYSTYFKITGVNVNRYSKEMFNQNSARLMLGTKKFDSYNFKFTTVSKGKNAWKEFDTKL